MTSDQPAPTQQTSRNMIMRVVVSLVLIALVLMGARAGFERLKSMRKDAERESTRVPPILVRAMIVERGPYTESLRGYGVARALRRTEAVAQIDGRVIFVEKTLDIGDAVHASAESVGNGSGPSDDTSSERTSSLPVLARIDGRDIADRVARASAEMSATQLEIGRLAAQYTNLEARIVLSREELKTAQREYARIQSLVPQTLTPSDLDRQRLQVTLQERRIQELDGQREDNTRQSKVASARVDAAKKSIALEERQSEYTTIYAPSEGRVLRRAVEVSDWVRRGDVLFELVDLSRVEIPVALSASRYDDVQAGSDITLFDPGSGRELLTTQVARIAPNIDTASRTFHVFVDVAGTPHENPMPPGRHVRAHVAGHVYPDVIAVPRQAFLDGKLFVAVDREQADATSAGPEPVLYTVQVRDPTVVRWLPGVALISKGLESGDRLLLTNLESIGDKGIVRITLGSDGDAAASK